MTNNLYSVRMRASIEGKHISGAERIVPVGKVRDTAQELMTRANSRSFLPDQVIIEIEPMKDLVIHELTALDVITDDATDVKSCRSRANRALQTAGVSAHAAGTAIHHLSRGAAPSGSTMRGAMIMDAVSGERLEPDQERGVRASRFDWTDSALDTIIRRLEAQGLTHYRTREALALATKVAHAPAMVAELCWSDEPEYTAGYVASLGTGYVRFPYLKAHGDPRGGRAFFVDRSKLYLDELIRYLQTVPVLINAVGEYSSIDIDQASPVSLRCRDKDPYNV